MMPAQDRRRGRFALIGAVAVVIVTASLVQAAPGDLDPTFDGDGKVTTNFIVNDEAHGVAIQSDGKIVAAGFAVCQPCAGPTEPHDFALARYNTDGSLDSTFDGDGKVTTDFAANVDEAFAVAIQADGKIVAGGSASISGADFALARYNADGSLDTTFDGDGKVTTDFGNGAEARGMAVQRDGKIVAAGIAVDSGTQNFGLARYNLDGSLDTTFSSDGKVMTDFGFANDKAFAVALQSDGKIVAAGVADGDFALARYKVCRVTSRRSSIPCR